MRRPSGVLVAVACVVFAAIVGCAHGSGDGGTGPDTPGATTYSDDDLKLVAEQLCEIYSRLPITKKITVDHIKQPRIRPIVVHRCQELVFEVEGGRASVSITDRDIARANQEGLKPGTEGVVGETLVLWLSEGEPSSLVIPQDYPDEGRAVFVRYHTECFDPDSAEPYECQGTSPPIVIIPPVRRP